MRQTIPVRLEWGIGAADCARCIVHVIDEGAVFSYVQSGHKRFSVAPLIRVRVRWNEGFEAGVARVTDLRAAGLLHRLKLGAFRFVDREGLEWECAV